ncbi:DUF2092 domain-containing protein [Shimia sp.]|uniref:DUF2092 domain-containing protein n=1 Tax=Shimia sp. TaxID=1954381 RepID=UPI003296BD8A
MKRVEVYGGLVLVTCLLSAPVVAQDAERIEPKAVEIVEAAAATLAGSDTIAANWFVSFDEVIDGREIVTHTRSGEVLLDRAQGYYAHAEQEEGARAYYFDNATISVHLLNQDSYVQAPYAGTFDALAHRIAEEYDTALPIWQLLVTDNADELLGDVTSAAYLGRKKIVGQDTHHVALSTYEYDLQIWVSDDPDMPVPIMMVGTNPYEQGWPQYRAFLSDWDFAPDIEEGFFTFEPDADMTRLAWPKHNSENNAEGEGQ